MRTRLFALFATVLMAVGIGLSGANPAQAAAGGTCAMNSFCLYQWTNYGAQVSGDRWQSSLNNIHNHPAHCLNLSPATWNNGTPVNDNSGSVQWRANAQTSYGQIMVFNWINCNPNGGWAMLMAAGNWDEYNYNNLSTLTWTGTNTNVSLYHTITSIMVL